MMQPKQRSNVFASAVVLALALFSGCASSQSKVSPEPIQTKEPTTDLVRETVLQKLPDLTESERMQVLTDKPRCGFYQMGLDDFGQHIFVWRVGDNREIVATWDGRARASDIQKATVSRTTGGTHDAQYGGGE